MNDSVIGLDIAKNIFHVYTMTAENKPVKKVLKRKKLLEFFANYQASLIGIEACGSAHHWARELTKLGHEVKMINAKFVKAFLKGNKNDFNDAEAIFDAVTRPNLREVNVKTIEQQDIQLVHCMRGEHVKRRTALVNQIRGLLLERGIAIGKGINQVRKRLPEILEDGENDLSTLSRECFAEHYEQLLALDVEIKAQDRRISLLCNSHEASQRFTDIPGIGPLTATIVMADLGNGKGYVNGRMYAASLGLVPRQHSSGGKPVLLGISKRGNRYIRTLLIHGARAVLRFIGGKTDKQSLWLQALVARRGMNIAAVALANKNARTLWALATKEEDYQPALTI
jgi:transposase